MGITCVTHPSTDISAESVAFWIRPWLQAPPLERWTLSQMHGSSQNGLMAPSYFVCSWVLSFELSLGLCSFTGLVEVTNLSSVNVCRLTPEYESFQVCLSWHADR